MQNDKNVKPIDLRDRTLVFSRAVIVFVKTLQHEKVAQPLTTQLIRSATSIGANFVEAKNSPSRKDFRHKVSISKKEASETLYWLELLEEFSQSKELSSLQKECREIQLILQKIFSTSEI